MLSPLGLGDWYLRANLQSHPVNQIIHFITSVAFRYVFAWDRSSYSLRSLRLASLSSTTSTLYGSNNDPARTRLQYFLYNKINAGCCQYSRASKVNQDFSIPTNAQDQAWRTTKCFPLPYSQEGSKVCIHSTDAPGFYKSHLSRAPKSCPFELEHLIDRLAVTPFLSQANKPRLHQAALVRRLLTDLSHFANHGERNHRVYRCCYTQLSSLDYAWRETVRVHFSLNLSSRIGVFQDQGHVQKL
jgi:hypothetical protein